MASLLMFAVPTWATTNYVTNGTFAATTGFGQLNDNVTVTDWTNTDYSGANVGYNFLFSPTDADDGTGVTGVDGAIQLWGPGSGSDDVNNGFTDSPVGGNFLAMDADYEVAAVTQAITPLTSGVSYTLSFYYAYAQQYTFTGPTTQQLTFSIGDIDGQTTQMANPTEGFTGWFLETFTFKADNSDIAANNPLLSLLAVGSPQVPPFVLVSDVSLMQTPEPGTLFLIGIGLLAVALPGRILRRRVRHQSF